MKHQPLSLNLIQDLHFGLTSILPKLSEIDVREITSISNKEGRLYREEVLLTKKMSEKRLNDFSAGRLSAKQALSKLAIYNYPILIGSNRAPLWPIQVVGSISHSKNICVSAVIQNTNSKALGIDIETIKQIDNDILLLICDETEILHLKNLEKSGYGSCNENAKIIFSIKESIFKCLNPLLSCWIDFKEMQITLDFNNKRYIATPNSNNLPLKDLKSISGKWHSNDYFHVSSCWL
ncbi:MAG: 4'-phosphopantetheinyl transferase EntD [Polaribacter sp.]|jgi:4'-phosphopantetheinyl transferase EntD